MYVCIYCIVFYIRCAFSENDEIKMINQSVESNPKLKYFSFRLAIVSVQSIEFSS